MNVEVKESDDFSEDSEDRHEADRISKLNSVHKYQILMNLIDSEFAYRRS